MSYAGQKFCVSLSVSLYGIRRNLHIPIRIRIRDTPNFAYPYTGYAEFCVSLSVYGIRQIWHMPLRIRIRDTPNFAYPYPYTGYAEFCVSLSVYGIRRILRIPLRIRIRDTPNFAYPYPYTGYAEFCVSLSFVSVFFGTRTQGRHKTTFAAVDASYFDIFTVNQVSCPMPPPDEVSLCNITDFEFRYLCDRSTLRIHLKSQVHAIDRDPTRDGYKIQAETDDDVVVERCSQ